MKKFNFKKSCILGLYLAIFSMAYTFNLEAFDLGLSLNSSQVAVKAGGKYFVLTAAAPLPFPFNENYQTFRSNLENQGYSIVDDSSNLKICDCDSGFVDADGKNVKIFNLVNTMMNVGAAASSSNQSGAASSSSLPGRISNFANTNNGAALVIPQISMNLFGSSSNRATSSSGLGSGLFHDDNFANNARNFMPGNVDHVSCIICDDRKEDDKKYYILESNYGPVDFTLAPIIVEIKQLGYEMVSNVPDNIEPGIAQFSYHSRKIDIIRESNLRAICVNNMLAAAATTATSSSQSAGFSSGPTIGLGSGIFGNNNSYQIPVIPMLPMSGYSNASDSSFNQQSAAAGSATSNITSGIAQLRLQSTIEDENCQLPIPVIPVVNLPTPTSSDNPNESMEEKVERLNSAHSNSGYHYSIVRDDYGNQIITRTYQPQFGTRSNSAFQIPAIPMDLFDNVQASSSLFGQESAAASSSTDNSIIPVPCNFGTNNCQTGNLVPLTKILQKRSSSSDSKQIKRPTFIASAAAAATAMVSNANTSFASSSNQRIQEIYIKTQSGFYKLLTSMNIYSTESRFSQQLTDNNWEMLTDPFEIGAISEEDLITVKSLEEIKKIENKD